MRLLLVLLILSLACVRTEIRDLRDPETGEATGGLQLIRDGIAVDSESMLISDNLAHYDELLERKYSRLISMPVAETSRSSQGLSAADAQILRTNIRQRLILYYQLHPNSPAPILSFQVNTSGVHWETVIVDLAPLQANPPLLQFEHWNFLGGDSLDGTKIAQIREGVVVAMSELRAGEFMEEVQISENMRQSRKPTPEEIVQFLTSKYQHRPDGSLYKLTVDGDKVRVIFRNRVGTVQVPDVVSRNEYLGDFFEITYPVYKGQDTPAQLKNLVARTPDLQTVRQPSPTLGKEEHLRQGPNNCGVAAAWITEQRASGKSPAQILQEYPERYHPYRREMLKKLHKKFGHVRIPNPRGGVERPTILAYPSATYGTAANPPDRNPPTLSSSDKSSESLGSRSRSRSPVSITPPEQPIGFAAPRRGTFKKWWIAPMVLVPTVTGAAAGGSMLFILKKKPELLEKLRKQDAEESADDATKKVEESSEAVDESADVSEKDAID